MFTFYKIFTPSNYSKTIKEINEGAIDDTITRFLSIDLFCSRQYPPAGLYATYDKMFVSQFARKKSEHRCLKINIGYEVIKNASVVMIFSLQALHVHTEKTAFYT
ncbi:hypothetical protein PS6_006118 [Mucor atramentarius]